MTKLAKAALDIGIQIAAADPEAMLTFHREALGLAFDHDLPLGGGRMQSRHAWGRSVVKLNHRRGGVEAAPPTGWGPVTLHGPDFTAHREVVDPEGNRFRLVAGPEQVLAIDLRVRHAKASLAFFAGLGLPRDGGGIRIGTSTVHVVEDEDARSGGLEGPGLRYVTLQVERADDAHAAALAAGATEGMAPRTLGDVARISFVVEPGGNWIELSQRASIVGSLTP